MNFLAISQIILLSGIAASLKPRFHWPRISYDFGTSENGKKIIKGDTFRLWNYAISGFALWKETIFISTLREEANFFRYEPNANLTISSLNYIELDTTSTAPYLTPYANEEEIRNIKIIKHLHVDACNRLWFIDNTTQQLIIVDLLENQPLKKITLFENNNPLPMTNLAIDVNETDCDNAYVYASHLTYNITLYVYHLKSDTIWKLQEPLLAPYTDGFDFTSLITPTSTLSKSHQDGYRTLYIQPRNSTHILSVSTRHLRDPNNGTDGDLAPKFQLLGTSRDSDLKSNLIYYDNATGILFYDTNRGRSLGCWNTNKFPNELTPNTTSEAVVFAVLESMSAIHGDGNGSLWISTRKTTSIFPVKKDDFYLYQVDINSFINNTVCRG